MEDTILNSQSFAGLNFQVKQVKISEKSIKFISEIYRSSLFGKWYSFEIVVLRKNKSDQDWKREKLVSKHYVMGNIYSISEIIESFDNIAIWRHNKNLLNSFIRNNPDLFHKKNNDQLESYDYHFM